MEKEQTVLLRGVVVHGKGLGRQIGCPTANLDIAKGTEMPETGVYISQILWKGQTYCGITNIGRRPTVDDDEAITIEVHILRFDQDIYGEELEVRLFERIRGVQKFEDVSALLAQIRRDCKAVQDFFGA